MARPTDDGKWDGPWELNQVPLGTDAFTYLKKQWDIRADNVRAFESITRSTDVETERLPYFQG